MHDDLQRLALRLGVVHAMAAGAKQTAGKLATGADNYERAILKRTNSLARQIRREGVGKNPNLEQEYCELLMQRRRMLQSYELAKRDGARMPDVGETKSLKKSLEPLPRETAPTIYLIAHCATSHNEGTDRITGWQDIPLSDGGKKAARELAVSLSSSGIEALATSDLQRAVDTATILHEVLGVPVAAPQSGFRAWDLGIFEGHPESDAGAAIRPYVADKPDVAVPGGEAFATYHERFMTSLTPLLILVGRGIRNAIGVVTHSKNLLLVDSWLHSGGGLGDLNLQHFLGQDVEPGTVLRLTMTPEGWEGTLFPPVEEDRAAGLVITAMPADMTLMKARAGKKPQPGQLGFQFDEEKHPREGKGEHEGKYRGGEFVPKGEGETGSPMKLWRQGNPVGRSGAGTFYALNPTQIGDGRTKPKAYEKTFQNLLTVPKEAHEPFAGNPSGTLRRQWLPHLDANEVWAKHGKKLGHKSAVDTGDWLVAHAAHERGHDGILYEGQEVQSLLDGFTPHPLFEKLNKKETLDPRKDWKENGIRSQSFKTWFGDWENNPAMASKVVDKDGEPQETYEADSSTVRDEEGNARVVYHGTAKGGFTEFDPEKVNPFGLYGPGFYFTEDKEVAETYQTKDAEKATLSRTLTKKDMQRAKAWVSTQLADKSILSSSEVSELRRLKGFTETKHGLEVMFMDSHGQNNQITRLLGHLNEHDPIHTQETPQAVAQTTYSVYLNIRNPFRVDVRHKVGGPLIQSISRVLDNHGGNGGVFGKTYSKEGELTGQHVFDILRDIYRDRRVPSSSARSPQEFALKVLEEAGHDGITHIGGDRMGAGHHHRVWIAFKPTQIKSSENEGTFDQTNPDIRKSFRAVDRQKVGWSGTWTFHEPVEKSVEPEPWVPPDMPRWQKRPGGSEQRYLPLNAIEDRAKLGEMVGTMKAGEWTWDKPIIHSGDQLITGSHRYVAAKEAGLTFPLKDFGEVCREGGVDFERAWREQAEPYGGWMSNLSNVIRLLPAGLAEKYGIELG